MKLFYLAVLALICAVSSSSVFSESRCNFELSESKDFRFKKISDCYYEIENHINYGGDNYISVDGRHGIDSVISDADKLYLDNVEYYFSYEEVDGPNFTRHQIENYPARHISVSGMEGYIGEWVGFMQMLPKYKKNDGYSLTVKCVSIALGDRKSVLTTKFCAPDTYSGNNFIKKYEALVMGAKLDKQKGQ
ncbi:hypothetical protein [Cupriavidus basilensis]|uniref:hypothetical protein n=1 Tax=Cupriavidus basilensis TaxID=68895 RepID=UPI0023E85F7A|nr:hypothetical protein [Cupriavidus basilensis]MDF3882986.1 hypothetical protein [Cupriavidus basilensis]